MVSHDELLVRIDEDEKFLEQYFGAKFKGQSALRAVVELHKPYGSESKGFICEFCMERALPAWVYPCPTIQAIEAELK